MASDPSTDMIDRLNEATDMIDADKRILICRIARKIENPRLLVTNLSGWLRRIAD